MPTSLPLPVLLVFALLIGLSIGSFINVVVYRVPLGLSVVRPRSFCPTCNTELSSFDNAPVLSYLVLRGKCRTCQAPISARYPIVEAATAVLFVGAAIEFHHSWFLPAIWIFLAGILALALIDMEHLRLPTRVVWIHLALVATALLIPSIATNTWHNWIVAFCCIGFWSGSFLVIHLISPEKLGFGDVRFSIVLALMLGFFGAGTALLGFFLSSLVGLIVSKIGRDQPIPFGVYLATGSAIALALAPLVPSPYHF